MKKQPPSKSLIAYYKDRAAIRGSVLLAPSIVGQAAGHPELGLIAVAADAFFASLSEWSADRSQRRFREWVEKLDAVGADIPVERLQTDDDFAYAVVTTTTLAARSRGPDKLHWLAMLLTNYDRLNQSGQQQDFFDFQSILDDINPRELQALLLIRKLENSPVRPPRIPVTDDASEEAAIANDCEWTQKFWPDVEKFVIGNGVARDQLTGFFDRLLRTGLFRQYRLFGDNKAHPWGYTTKSLDALEAAITRHDNLNLTS
jgi:hypothetical protein